MTAAIDLDAIDAAWDDEPEAERSGVRARPAPGTPPPLPVREVAARLLRALDAAERLRRELEERMGPGERVEVEGAVVEFVAARINGDGVVVARSGVRVRRKERA